MICYRDMTFCSRSKDCANTDCFRMVDEEVEQGAAQMGLDIAYADMSDLCEHGFTPKPEHVWKCPGCGHRVTDVVMGQLVTRKLPCSGCGKHELTEYVPGGTIG